MPKLEDFKRMIEEIIDEKLGTTRKPKKGTTNPEKEISKRQVKILDTIASSNKEVKAEAFASIAVKAGYPRAKGASAMFRGKNASLKYRVEKFIELTPRGNNLLLAAKSNGYKTETAKMKPKPAEKPIPDTSEVSQETQQMSAANTPS